ncbi:MAG: DNA primase, partial [Pseudomonadota bacterium]|nr:DNA primase [Pseudomonadota bacterium]
QVARAILLGLTRFPRLIGQHGDALADLPLNERGLARLRDLLLDAAMEAAELDPQALHTILAAKGEAALVEELSQRRGLAFSFTRRDADPERACRDLALVIETLAARPGIDAALEAATDRLGKAWEDAAFEEQKRLLAARDEADRQLATLIEGDAD